MDAYRFLRDVDDADRGPHVVGVHHPQPEILLREQTLNQFVMALLVLADLNRFRWSLSLIIILFRLTAHQT